MATPARAIEPDAREEKSGSKRIMGLEQSVFFALLLQLLALAFAWGTLNQKVEDLKEDVTSIKGVLLPKPGAQKAAQERVAKE